MKFFTNNRYLLFAFLTFVYSTPLAFFSLYSVAQLPKSKSWIIVSSGFLIIAISSLVFLFLLIYLDKKFHRALKIDLIEGSEGQVKVNKVTSLDQSLDFEEKQMISRKNEEDALLLKESSEELLTLKNSLAENQEKITELTEQLALIESEKKECIEESKRLESRNHKVSQDFSDYKLFGEEQLKQKNLQLTAAQMTIADQTSEIEKRQDQICQLNSKIHDLSYEIRTLIHLHEVDSTPSSIPKQKSEKLTRPTNKLPIPIQTLIPEAYSDEWNVDSLPSQSQIQTASEAWLLLRKCINIAQRLTGANYYSNENSRFREFSSSHFTIDQRRLFDSLKNEESGLILVYSQKENKLLFANSQTKHLLDCGPEKFINEFATFFQDGLSEWKKALSLLNYSAESQSRLLAKTKNGSEVVLNAHFGLIPTGLFRNYVICVLYPV